MSRKAVTPFELAQVIGTDAVDRLNEAFYGRRYTFTKRARTSDFESLEARNQRIRELSFIGYPHDRLSAEFGLAEKTIRDIINHRPDKD